MNNKYFLLLVLLILGPLSLFSQQTITVKGQVLDENAEGLPFAAVIQVGNLSVATTTDMDGNFVIDLSSAKAKLQISYLGYETKEVSVITGKQMIIKMEPSSTLLDEVVTIGYGTQKRITHIGATSQMSNKELRSTPTSTIQNALAGKLPGLFQQQAGGQPGSDAASIKIRGVATFANVDTSPLLLIDDVETSFGTLSQLDPNEVENIALLKDASSTAIYGVKGANGVILVTTRRGKEGAPRITLRSDFGLQSPTFQNELLGSYDALNLFAEYHEQMAVGSSLSKLPGLVTPEALEHFRKGDMPHLYPSVNWYDEVYRSAAPQTKHNIDISGGSKHINYFLSLGYNLQNGILKELKRDEDFNNNYYNKRYNIRANFDIKPTKDLKIQLNLASVFSEVNKPYLPDPHSSGGAIPIFRRIASGILPPWAYPVHNQDGSYGGNKSYSINPLMIIQYGGYERNFANRLVGNVNATHKLDFITKGLSVKGGVAITNVWSYDRILKRDNFPEYQLNPATGQLQQVMPDTDPLPILRKESKSKSPFIKINTQLMLNYSRQFGDHSVTAIAMCLWDNAKTYGKLPAKSFSVLGRVAYDYKFKYLAEISMSRNGSNLFKAHQKYGYFPAFAAGWNVSEEPFLKSALQAVSIDFLKIRGSIGLVGSDAFPSGMNRIYKETYVDSSSSTYGDAGKRNRERAFYGDNTDFTINGVWPGRLGNDNITWEKEIKKDLGLEMRMFNSRLKLDLGYFDNLRYDILTFRSSIPDMFGISAPPVNLGKVRNKGVEASFNWNHQVTPDFSYRLNGNFSLAKNKIIERDEVLETKFPMLLQTGRPHGQQFGFQVAGYYKDQEEIQKYPDNIRGDKVQPGDLRYKDIGGPDGKPDGVIDNYDKGPIGYPSFPQLTFGFTLGTSYKGFDVSASFQGAALGSISSTKVFNMGIIDARPRRAQLDRWRPGVDENGNAYDNSNVKFPRLGGLNYETSDFWLRPRDYVRLKNVELGYNVPKEISKKLGLHALRFYSNALNLLTWSNMGIYDVDPEANSGGEAAYSSYPQMRVFNVGCQITF